MFVQISLLIGILGCNSSVSTPQPETASSKPSLHLPYFNSPEFTPRWLAPTEVPSDFHRVPEFSLTNQHGENITAQNLDGKVTVVDFFFTSCPGICPRLKKNMAIIDEAFERDENLLLLSHTVTPTKDTVEVLKEYASDKGITSTRWHLLTGARADIYNLGRSVYFVEEDLGVNKDPNDFLHTENFVLIDKKNVKKEKEKIIFIKRNVTF